MMPDQAIRKAAAPGTQWAERGCLQWTRSEAIDAPSGLLCESPADGSRSNKEGNLTKPSGNKSVYVMLSNSKVILEHLTVKDADFFHTIYKHPELTPNFDESPFLQNEEAAPFTERIISLCDYIFTIRPLNDPGSIIGECALHHWDKQKNEIAIGGSLLPEYWGKGYMQAAFELLSLFAKQELGVSALLGSTKTRNSKAIRFAEKMGFVKDQSDEQNTIMRKKI